MTLRMHRDGPIKITEFSFTSRTESARSLTRTPRQNQLHLGRYKSQERERAIPLTQLVPTARGRHNQVQIGPELAWSISGLIVLPSQELSVPPSLLALGPYNMANFNMLHAFQRNRGQRTHYFVLLASVRSEVDDLSLDISTACRQ